MKYFFIMAVGLLLVGCVDPGLLDNIEENGDNIVKVNDNLIMTGNNIDLVAETLQKQHVELNDNLRKIAIMVNSVDPCEDFQVYKISECIANYETQEYICIHGRVKQ